jgi:REP element-mobilizing transposase RayT
VDNIGEHHRRSIRLREFDYSRAGAYFLTICACNQEPLFGQIVNGEMALNEFGQIVEEEIKRTGEIRQNFTIDRYGVMPNHVHIIVVISNVGANGSSPEMPSNESVGANGGSPGIPGNESVGANGSSPGVSVIGHTGACSSAPLRKSSFRLKPNTIGSFVAGFKSTTTKRINTIRNTRGHPVWQRNYYEHVIRDERELNKIRRYIINNPPQWEYDRENRNGIPIDEKMTFWSKFLNEW